MRSVDGLKRLLHEYSIEPDSDSGLKLQTYLSLLEKWNRHINLTSNIGWFSLEPLFHEGIWAAARYPADCKTHLDIGSGGGFPAIILKLFNTQIELDLVESRAKKCAFLETVVFELELKRVRIRMMRLENLLASCDQELKTWDCVSWKAVRLTNRDLQRLYDKSSKKTQLWMFHGTGTPVEDARVFFDKFAIIDKLPVHGLKKSFLSILRPVK